jgi:hypothetical protein
LSWSFTARASGAALFGLLQNAILSAAYGHRNPARPPPETSAAFAPLPKSRRKRQFNRAKS